MLSRPCTVGFPGLDPDLEPALLAKGLAHQKVITSLEPNINIFLCFISFLFANAKAAFWGVLSWEYNKIAWHLYNELESLWVHFVASSSRWSQLGNRQTPQTCLQFAGQALLWEARLEAVEEPWASRLVCSPEGARSRLRTSACRRELSAPCSSVACSYL